MAEFEEMIGIYAGSFDPITRGHMGVICSASLKVHRLVIGFGVNPAKANSGMFTPDEKIEIFDKALEDFLTEVENNPKAKASEKKAVERIRSGEVKIEREIYTGYTVDFAIKHGAQQMFRGQRPSGDEQEASLANANDKLAEARGYALGTTIIMTPDTRYIFASSSVIRQLATEPKAIEEYLYPSTAEAVAAKVKQQEQENWQKKVAGR